MRPALYTADCPGPGQVSIMAKPRGGDWLPDEMTALKAAGAGILVCALTPAELQEADLGNEPRAARDVGLEFAVIPVPDRTVPDLDTVLAALHRLAGRLRNGTHIVIHCRFGIGRSSLLAASLMILNGTDPDTAWKPAPASPRHPRPRHH